MHPQILRITHEMERCDIGEGIGQAVETSAGADAAFQPLVTGATDQHQIFQAVGGAVIFIKAGDIAKGAEGRQVVDIMLAPRRFMDATLAAAIVVARTNPLALFLPVGAIIIERVEPLPLLG